MAVDFGSELACTNDIASDGRVVTGFRVVGEAIYRRWITPRGRLIASMCAALQSEALKDERVDSIRVTAEVANDTLTVNAIVQTGQGPFTLTVAVDAVTTELLSVL